MVILRIYTYLSFHPKLIVFSTEKYIIVQILHTYTFHLRISAFSVFDHFAFGLQADKDENSIPLYP